MFELFVEGRNTLKTQKNNYMSKYRIISRDLNKIYNEQFRVFFLLSLAKGAVGLTTLRSTQFNIYTSVSVNICFFFQSRDLKPVSHVSSHSHVHMGVKRRSFCKKRDEIEDGHL